MKSAEVIGWALGGLEREIMATRERLASLTAQANVLRARLGQRPVRAAVAAGSAEVATRVRKVARKRRAMSADARKRISELMRKRWAERKKKGYSRL